MKAKAFLIIFMVLTLTAPIATAETTAMGRYVEREVVLPENIDWIISMCNDSNGDIIIYASSLGGICRIVIDKDDNWDVENVTWTDQFSDIGLIQNITERDKTVLISYYDVIDEDYYTRLAMVKDGAFSKLDLKQTYRDIRFISGMGLSGSNVLLNGSSVNLSCYGLSDGERLYSVADADGKYAEKNGKLFAVCNQNGTIIRADADTGSNRDDISEAPLTGEDLLAFDDDSLYIANRTGIYRVAQNGSIWEKIVDGALCSLRMPSYDISGFAVHNGEPFVTLASDESKLIRFSFDSSIPAYPSHELRIYTLGDSPVLTQAASAYQTEHPDYIVNINNLLTDGAGATTDDVIRALNTELLAGAGPDIMLLDGMPIDSYIEKGVLADISGVVNSMDLLENVVSSFQNDGKIYAFPTSILLPVIIGRPEALDGMEDFDDLTSFCENWTGDKEAMGARTMSGWFDSLSTICYPAWFDENGALNTQVLADFLNGIKTLYEYCGTETDEYGDYYDEFAVGSIGGFLPSVSLMNGRSGRTFELLRVANGESALYPTVVSGFGLGMIDFTLADSFNGNMIHFPGQARGVYSPTGIIGVNAHTAQPEAALEFVGTILSQSVQDVELYQGFPVNNASLKACIDKEDIDYSVSTTTIDDETGEENTLEGRWPTREMREHVGELIQNATTPCIPDKALIRMMKEELTVFFEGGMDTSSAVSRINSRLRAYLAE